VKSFAFLTISISAALILATPATADTVVRLGHFNHIALHGGGEITLRHGEVQRVTLVRGSTEHTTFRLSADGELEIDACNFSCPHQYELKIEIVSPDIRGAAIDGGGEIRTDGAFPNQDKFSAAINGGGVIDVRAIRAASAEASVNGGGKILVTANVSLAASVAGGGEIVYRGKPAVSQSIAGGGSVERQPD
jgi:hypothetical protein